jgi:predicted  nucleic acid-binding Zn-ribbon protein
MDATVATALIVAGSGTATLVIAEIFRRFKSSADKMAARAAVAAVEQEADAKTMTAMTAAFGALTAQMQSDVSDLRARLGRVEEELMISRRENSVLRADNERLTEENVQLRGQVELIRGERDNLNQTIESMRRVHRT